MIKNKVQFYFFLVFSSIIMSCCDSGKEKKITLEDWRQDKGRYEFFKETLANGVLSCDSLVALYKDFELNEFKENAHLKLADCFIIKGNKSEAQKYVLKAFASGQHISWIDSLKYSSIYREIKEEYPELRQKFWRNKDTTYFSDIEKMYSLDQSSIRTFVSNPTEINRMKEQRVHDSSANYLLDYSAQYGFPKPMMPASFNKEEFRIHIDPTILAVHAPVDKKIKLRDYAIKSAEAGENSWRVPITIGVTFFTQLSKDDAKPIRFLYFDKNNKLKVEDSFLQLYVIKKFIRDNDFSNIVIRPSKANSLSQDALRLQLKEIKNTLIKELGFKPSSIEISESHEVSENQNNLNYNEGGYDYIFHTF